jgi:flagellar hook protein FlgE
MGYSLFTGLSGLRAFETSLDVVGNNIANSNTVGYRSSRTTFGDLLSITSSAGSAPGATIGGTNPNQLGLGVGVKSIDINTGAGSILATDRNLDLAIFGPGFFIVNDGQRDLFTRAGTFGFDANGTLVDLGSGFVVQSIAGSSIVVPPDAESPPQATSSITMKGNLPATVTGPLEEILATANPLTTGDPAEITGTNTGPFALSNGDTMTIQVDGNPPQTVTFTTADFVNIGAATASEVAAAINAQISGATASASGGAVVLESATLGEDSSLKLTDSAGNPAFTLGLQTVLVEGTEQAAGTTTDLNDLISNETDYLASNNDGITISGALSDGTEFEDTFVYGTDGTTVGDLVTFIQAQFSDATVEYGADGNITVTANEAGAAKYSITIEDAPGNIGASDWSTAQFVEEQPGTDPDEVNTAITVYDSQGAAHILALKFQRVDALEWQLVASLPDDDGVVIDGSVTTIRFNADGSLQDAGGTGAGDPNVEIQFGAGGAQTVTLGFGTPKSGTATGLDGITQFGGPSTAQAVEQDGFAFGSLADVIVTDDGAVRAVFTNGQSEIYGEIALANFANAAGLAREGNNMFSATVNSGIALRDNAGGAGGTIQSGILESSNVDLAEEFVRMIEAQRGYQASARVIRASEELLTTLLQNI